MEKNEFMIWIIFVVITTIILNVSFILSYKHNKFKKYIKENYHIINDLFFVHKKYEGKIKVYKNEIYFSKRYLNTRRQFDNFKGNLTYDEIVYAYKQIEDIDKLIKENCNYRDYYVNELFKKITQYNYAYIENEKYKDLKIRKYIDSYINKNNKPKGIYNNRSYYVNNIVFKMKYNYRSQGGRVNLNNYCNYNISLIKELYRYHVLNPLKEAEEAQIRKSNRLYKNKIYFFIDIHQPNHICIGQTTKDDVEDRIKQEYKNMPNKPWKLLHWDYARFKNGEWFSDYDFHQFLYRAGFKHTPTVNGKKSEWFNIDIEQAKTLFDSFKKS